ncbi:MAG: DMT family transporter [Ignavibacteriales bacterium]
MKQKYFAESILLMITVLWGATFTIVKQSLRDASPIFFITLRFSVAFILLIPFLFKKRNLFNLSSAKAGAILGLLLFFSFAAQTIGLKFTTATKSGFLTGTLVVLIPVFQLLIEKKKPSAWAIFGVILVFIGIIFLSSGGNSIFTFLSDLGKNFNYGDFLTLICAILFAVHVVYLDIFSRRENIFVLFSLQIGVTAFFGFLFSIFFNLINFETISFNLSRNLLLGILYTSIFATIITTALQTKYQQYVSPTNAGLIYSFEPIFAAVIAFFALNEKITNFGLIGCVLIFLGLISSELFENYFKDGKQRNQS